MQAPIDKCIGIFDADLKLVYSNRLFRELRRYPAKLTKPGTTLEAMIRFNAERGDFGVGDADARVADRMAEIETSGEREIERKSQTARCSRFITGNSTASASP